MRIPLIAVALVVSLTAATFSNPATGASTCLSITPLYGTESQTVGANTSGNQIDFLVRNEASGSLSVTVSATVTGNISNLAFFGGTNPFTLMIHGESLDVGYTFDAGAAQLKNSIIVTATAGCGAVSDTFRVAILP